MRFHSNQAERSPAVSLAQFGFLEKVRWSVNEKKKSIVDLSGLRDLPRDFIRVRAPRLLVSPSLFSHSEKEIAI